MKQTKSIALSCALLLLAACQKPASTSSPSGAASPNLTAQEADLMADESVSLVTRSVIAQKAMKEAYLGLSDSGKPRIWSPEFNKDLAIIAGGAVGFSYFQSRVYQIQMGIKMRTLLADLQIDGISNGEVTRIYSQVMKQRFERVKQGASSSILKNQITIYEVRDFFKGNNLRLEEAIAKNLNDTVKAAKSDLTLKNRAARFGNKVLDKMKGAKQAYQDYTLRPSAKKFGGNVETPAFRVRTVEQLKKVTDFVSGRGLSAEAEIMRNHVFSGMAIGAVAYGMYDAFHRYQEASKRLQTFATDQSEGMADFYITTVMGNAALIAMPSEQFKGLATENPEIAQFMIDLYESYQREGAAALEIVE